MSESFKELKSGTKLPLLNLKGKPYLQVAHRVVWFREEHPKGRIETEIIERNDQYALVAAKIITEDNFLLAMAHKVEHAKHFADYIEKAETSAIGRALALCGYGTQFEPELDEKERLADSPIEPVKKESTPIKIVIPENISYTNHHAGHKSYLKDLFDEYEVKDSETMKKLSSSFVGKPFAEIKQILKAKLYEV